MSSQGGLQRSLFAAADETPSRDSPLAARMRPRTLDEFLGQHHLVDEGKSLHRAIASDRVGSLILWGPPGCGKTTLARIMARATHSAFESMSAVNAGVPELRKVIDAARIRRSAGSRTLLFVDEVHRWTKAQQDAVMPHVEDGLITLIGATTENPSFEVNAALLSRCRVARLEPLDDCDIENLIGRALGDSDRGIGAIEVVLTDDGKQAIVRLSGGDARTALNTLEASADTATPDPSGVRRIDQAIVEDVVQRRALPYDKAGDQHYDVVSAFIKSIRGSDPDAAVYWLARMIEAGEDPMFIARRLVLSAAEDVGLASPQALTVAVAAQQAVHAIGMPEGYLPLTEATIFLALAPKSNTAMAAFQAAREEVGRSGALPVPLHLRNAPTRLMAGMGYGRGYQYAHDFPGARVTQAHLPDQLVGRRYYVPGQRGQEPRLNASRSENPGPAAPAD
ncbi:MAG: replication-associated recombination protein A [Chloroflexota bacterium]|nr:MAG: replication-associated recombination protein A [Chloroflexota bacterium]